MLHVYGVTDSVFFSKLESYVHARDHYLKPGGALFPSKGNIYLAPFTDATLWTETMGKARFW